ncbi:MAG: hypothetical protein Q9Q40_04940 [Acidobacteriota bacterium]|nr:hypothetical protein [Acidobacteriota bacterium]MDQ7087458.1 hypothetical protein [Acidobacteriota bacterium]
MIKKVLPVVLGLAVAANGALILDALTFGFFVPRVLAQDALANAGDQDSTANDMQGVHPAETGPRQAEEVYRDLVEALTRQKEALERKARELTERERQLAVVRAELLAEREALDKQKAELARQREELENAGAPNFGRLLKAYEGMDPENAASALAELYARDRNVVVDLLLGLKSRQAALTLDALASTHPKIAAELSLQIWQKDPKVRRR